MGELKDVLQVFGYAIGGIIAWIFGSKIWEAIAPKFVDRYFHNKDKQNEIHTTNQTAQIDFDKFAFQTFVEEFKAVKLEVKELRAELKEVRTELNSQVAQNAKLDNENKNLKETNERQQQEITDLRSREVLLQSQVQTLTITVGQLQTELALLKHNSKKD